MVVSAYPFPQMQALLIAPGVTSVRAQALCVPHCRVKRPKYGTYFTTAGCPPCTWNSVDTCAPPCADTLVTVPLTPTTRAYHNIRLVRQTTLKHRPSHALDGKHQVGALHTTNIQAVKSRSRRGAACNSAEAYLDYRAVEHNNEGVARPVHCRQRRDGKVDHRTPARFLDGRDVLDITFPSRVPRAPGYRAVPGTWNELPPVTTFQHTRSPGNRRPDHVAAFLGPACVHTMPKRPRWGIFLTLRTHGDRLTMLGRRCCNQAHTTKNRAGPVAQ